MPRHRGAIEESDLVFAPELIVPEITNAIWKYYQFEDLDLDTCQHVLDLSLGLVDTFVPSTELYREAFLLARTGKIPAYDMSYPALARREDATLLTVDQKLRKEAARLGVCVI